jgi:hypothetical protein
MHTEHLDGATIRWWSSQDEDADRSPYNIEPVIVRPDAKRIEWRDSPKLSELDASDVNRYDVIRKLVAAGIDAAWIDVYNGPYEDSGVYWVVLLDDRSVALTDDGEGRVIHLEGLWPFTATFSGPAGAWTEVHESIGMLLTRIVTWCTPPDGRRRLNSQHAKSSGTQWARRARDAS